jgi:hypothetical protein
MSNGLESRAGDILKVLSVFHGVAAGLTLLIALVPTLFMGLGAFLVTVPGRDDPGAGVVGSIFAGLGCLFFLLVITYAVALGFAARNLWVQRGWSFCLVVAAVSCVWFPYGTVLGVVTLIFLLQEDVQRRFGRLPGDA